MTYERQHIQQMHGYLPGEQLNAANVIKLNTNENPYPPSPNVMAALQDVTGDQLRKYPSPNADQFRQTAAALHGVKAENIIATNGGDELLRLCFTTFVEPGTPIGVAEPSYSLYPVLAAIHDSPVFRVDLKDDWSLADDFAEQMNAAGVALTFVVNPHAPTGKLLDINTLANLAEKLDGVLLIDEAYVDFTDNQQGQETPKLIERFDNVILLRTMSKGYSLAGIRYGYGIACEHLILPMLSKTKDSYNVNGISQALATAALEDQAYAQHSWQQVRAERERVQSELAELGIHSLASQTNFLLCTIPHTLAGGAESLYQTLKAQNILVRYFSQERLADKLRISIGTAEENTHLLTAIKAAI